MKHGKGVLKFFNGAVYQGLFKKNSFEGYGVFSDQGYSYDGHWKRSKKHGDGVYTFQNGSRFEG